MSFLAYEYPLIEKLISSEYFAIANPADITGMKLQAIQWRATKKDYVDLALLLEHYGCKQLFTRYQQKYQINVHDSLLIKYLLYIQDAEHTTVVFTNPTDSREKAIMTIQKKVKEYLDE